MDVSNFIIYFAVVLSTKALSSYESTALLLLLCLSKSAMRRREVIVVHCEETACVAKRELELVMAKMKQLRRAPEENTKIHEICYPSEDEEKEKEEVLMNKVSIDEDELTPENAGGKAVIINNKMEEDECKTADDVDDNNDKEEVDDADEEVSVADDCHRSHDCNSDVEGYFERECNQCECSPCLWDKYGEELRAYISMLYNLYAHRHQHRCKVQRAALISARVQKYWLKCVVLFTESDNGTFIPKCVQDGMWRYYDFISDDTLMDDR
jgi:hypothetical protein